MPIVAEPVSATLAAPDSVRAASRFTVDWTGPDNEGDYIAIGNAAGRRIPYSSNAYTAQHPKNLPLTAPEAPGKYSIVYITGGTVVESRPLVVTGLSATLDVPATVPANSAFKVIWTGPNNPKDHVTIGTAGGRPIPYSSRGYTAQHPGQMTLKAPERPGDYTVVYITGSTVVTFAPFKVSALSATLQVPDTVPAGSPFTVKWTGPDNKGDRLRIHKADGKWIPYASYAYTALNPGQAELVAPEEPGPFTVAYVTGDSVVTTVPLTVAKATASLQAANQVDAGIAFPVTWRGPGNRRDVIVMVGSDPNFPLARGYIANSQGDRVTLQAPQRPGSYELRYLTPGGKQLAARAIAVVAPPQKPGTLVVQPAATITGLSALEVVLDGPDRCCSCRRHAAHRHRHRLSHLLREMIPERRLSRCGPGHKESASRTDLEVPLAPLNSGPCSD